MHPSFVIADSLRFGWKTTRAHSGLVFKVVLSVFAVQIIFEVASKVWEDTAVGALITFLLVLCMIPLGVGMTIVMLRLARGEKATYRQIIPPFGLLVRYFVSGVLAVVLAIAPLVAGALLLLLGFFVGGFIFALMASAAPVWMYVFISLCMLLGFVVTAAAILCTAYLSLQFALVRFAVIDGAAIVASLRESTRLMQGSRWQMFLFFVAALVLNILGFLVFFVGLLVTVPVTVIAHAHIYQQLKARVESKA